LLAPGKFGRGVETFIQGFSRIDTPFKMPRTKAGKRGDEVTSYLADSERLSNQPVQTPGMLKLEPTRPLAL
jgi:hypothetical protein